MAMVRSASTSSLKCAAALCSASGTPVRATRVTVSAQFSAAFAVRKTERRHGGVIETLGHRRSLRERGRAFRAGMMVTPFAQRKFNALFKS
jgi:hypothetical protein